ncbi:hypothetical protein GF406_24890 [candidate division KSB1 bacterium]|nr:hypothetical protein [candidate division KSB1 bacterium]
MTNISVDLQSEAAGDYTIFTFSFTNQSIIPSAGSFYFKFKEDNDDQSILFNLDQLQVASIDPIPGVTVGSFESITLSANGFVATLKRSGQPATSIPAGTNIVLKMGLIRNPLYPVDYARVEIRTLDGSDQVLDTGITSNFTIFGAIESFDFSPLSVSQATAGDAIPLQVTNARDKNNQNASGWIWVAVEGDDAISRFGYRPQLNPIYVDNGSSGAVNQKVFKAGNDYRFSGSADQYDYSTVSGTFDILSATADSLTLSGYPSTVQSEVAFPDSIYVSARDQFGNISAQYTHTIAFSTSDPSSLVQLPADYTFNITDQGRAAFDGGQFELATVPGPHTLHVEQTDNPDIDGKSQEISVSDTPLYQFDIALVDPVIAGEPTQVRVSNFTNGSTLLNGVISLDFDDGAPHLSPNGTAPILNDIIVRNGSGTGSIVLTNVESNVIIRATSPGAIDRTVSIANVLPGDLGRFIISGYPSVISKGTHFPSAVQVSVQDGYGNAKTNYTGSIIFASDTDVNMTLPSGPQAFSFQDSKSFSGSLFAFNTSGSQTFRVVDQNTGISSTSDPILVGSVIIKEIYSQAEKVGEGQTGIRVLMDVQNVGGQDFSISNADLHFVEETFGTNYDPYIDVSFTENITLVPAGGIETLRLNVNIDDGLPIPARPLIVTGIVQGTSGGNGISVQETNLPLTWTVFARANLDVTSILINDNVQQDTVFQGQSGIPLSMTVKNIATATNSAAALLENAVDLTPFVFYHQGSQVNPGDYTTVASLTNPTTVSKGQTVTLDYTLKVANTAEPGLVTVYANLPFKDAISDQSRTAGVFNGDNDQAIMLTESRILVELTEIVPSQLSVTAGQDSVWDVTVAVANRGESSIGLDLDPTITYLQFRNGIDIDNSFTYQQPLNTDEGGTNIPAGETRHLTFRVTQTSTRTGPVTILATVETQAGIRADSFTSQVTGSVLVQSPENLDVASITAMQTTVTIADPNFTWPVSMILQNNGASSVELDFNETSLDLPASEFNTAHPNSFLGGGTILAGGQRDTLIFDVSSQSTATQLGTFDIGAIVHYTVLNTGAEKSFTVSGLDQITVQDSAKLEILHVHTSRDTVTRGMVPNWQVITVLSNEQGGADLKVDFDVDSTFAKLYDPDLDTFFSLDLQAPSTLASGDSILRAGQIDSVIWSLSSLSDALVGKYQLWSRARAIELNRQTAMVDTTLESDQIDSLLIQYQGDLEPVAATLRPRNITRESFVKFQVDIRNNGESTLSLDPQQTRFRLGSTNMIATLDPASQRIISASEQITLSFIVQQVPSSIAIQSYIPELRLVGIENGNDYEKNLILDTMPIQVVEAGELAILFVQPDPATVSVGQERDWTINVGVQNNGAVDLQLDSARVEFYNNGNNISVLFDRETAFSFSNGGTVLAPSQKDTLVFNISHVDSRTPTGQVTLPVKIWMTDAEQTTRNVIVETKSGTHGLLTVQETGYLELLSIRSSQPTVTRGQSESWRVWVKLSNPGGSQIDILGGQSRLDFGENGQWNNSFTVEPASDLQVPPGSIDSLSFAISQVGTNINLLGELDVSAFVSAREMNTAQITELDTLVNGAPARVKVTVQDSAFLRIKNLFADVPNFPFVNVGQEFFLSTRMENPGNGDLVEYARLLYLHQDDDFEFVNGNQTVVDSIYAGQVVFSDTDVRVRAIGSSGSSGSLTVTIDSSKARNTGQDVEVLPPVSPADTLVTLTFQDPAVLSFDSLFTSQDTLPAGTIDPWTITARVSNAGEADLLLKTPSSDDITFNREGYVVKPPTLTTAQKRLSNGESLDLLYTVINTPSRSGIINIDLELTANDANDTTAVLGPESKNAQIYVRTSSGVRLSKTFIDPSLFNGVLSNDTLYTVTGQVFPVSVEVTNVGAQRLDSVWVNMFSDQYEFTESDSVLLTSVASLDTAVFYIKSPENASLKESLNSKILKAIGLDKAQARIFPAQDSTQWVKTHTPAQLTIERVDINAIRENRVSFGHDFTVNVSVRNDGQEPAKGVKVKLAADPEIVDLVDTLKTFPVDIAAGESFQLAFAARAQSTSDIVTFSAEIDTASGRFSNSAATLIDPGTARFAQAIIQSPAVLQVDDVIDNVTEIQAGDSKNMWTIKTIVRNSGEADLLFTGIDEGDIQFRTNGQLDRDFEIVPPTRMAKRNDFVLGGGQVDTLIYRVSENGKIAGESQYTVSLTARDLNKPDTQTPLSAAGTGNVTVTSRAWIRVDRVEIPSFGTAIDGSSLINRDQEFKVQIRVETGEFAGVDSVMIRLVSDKQLSLSEPDTLFVDFIPAEEESISEVTLTADSDWDPTLEQISETFTAEILRAKAQGSQLLAQIRAPDRPEDAQATVWIQVPAIVDMEGAFSNPSDSIVTLNQEFDLKAIVTNLGSGPVRDGRVMLNLPDGYRAKNAAGEWIEGSLTKGFKIQNLESSKEIVYNLMAPETESTPDTLVLSLVGDPIDVNSGQPAEVARSADTLFVSTLNTNLSVESFAISAPSGATDGVLSTEQTFRIRAAINATKNLQEVTAKLLLPSTLNYQLSTLAQVPVNESEAQWELLVPNEPILSPHTFRLEVQALNGDDRITVTDSLTVESVVRRANLYLTTLEVSRPLSVMQDGQAVFSTGQTATLRTSIQNFGDAGILDDGTGTVRLDFLASGLTLVDDNDSQQVPFNVDSDVSWDVKAPSVVTDLKEIRVHINNIPLDENSGLPALISNSPNILKVRTENRGSIVVHSLRISEPSGATDDTLSTGQNFRIQAEISSDRIAPDMKARIHFSSEEFIPAVQDVDVPQGDRVLVYWSVRAPDNASPTGERIWITVNGTDQGSGEKVSVQIDPFQVIIQEATVFSILPSISFPEGLTDLVSTDQEFRLTATVQHTGAPFIDGDSLSVQLIRPETYTFIQDNPIKRSAGDTITWALRAPSDPPPGLSTFRFVITDVPRDANSGQKARVRNEDVRFAIQTVEKAKIVLRAFLDTRTEIDSGSVRIGSEFQVMARMENAGQAGFAQNSTAKARLVLPESGFTTSEPLLKTTTGNQFSWRIQAPTELIDTAQRIQVILQEVPFDQYAGTPAAVLDDTADVFVTTEAGMVLVSQYPVRQGHMVGKGNTDVPVLGLRFKNKDSGSNTQSELRGLQLTFMDRLGNPLRAVDIISQIKAVNHSDPQQVYIQTTEIGQQRFQFLDFRDMMPDTIKGIESDSIEIRVDILPDAKVDNFKVVLDSTSHVYAYDAISSFQLAVGNADGQRVDRLAINSNVTVLVGRELGDSFFTYPNPFGNSQRPITKFVYTLKQDSDVTIRIFTLTGELVREMNFTKDQNIRETRAGMHEGEVIWDGKNGNGIRVLNGVYIAYITAVDYGEIAKTKIAVVK